MRTLPSGEKTFVKPLDERMSMSNFLSKMTSDSDEVLYLQSQDGNIYRSEAGMRDEPELTSFQKVIQRDVPWMKEAMGTSFSRRSLFGCMNGGA